MSWVLAAFCAVFGVAFGWLSFVQFTVERCRGGWVFGALPWTLAVASGEGVAGAVVFGLQGSGATA